MGDFLRQDKAVIWLKKLAKKLGWADNTPRKLYPEFSRV